MDQIANNFRYYEEWLTKLENRILNLERQAQASLQAPEFPQSFPPILMPTEDRAKRLQQLEAERDALLRQDDLTDEDRRMIVYFIREKGDITRWCDWEARKDIVLAAYPSLKTALDQAEVAKIMIENVLDKIEEDL